MLALADALNIMDSVDPSGQPVQFSIRFVKRKNGELVFYPKASKAKTQAPVELPRKADMLPAPDRIKRSPNHSKNQTRNLLLPDGRIRKIHIRLITEFNGHQIFY